MPRLNTKHQALMGTSVVSLDGTIIDTTSGGARWFGGSFIYQRLRIVNGAEKATIRLVDGAGNNIEISTKGANNLFACKMVAAAFLTNEGVRELTDTLTYPQAGPGDGSVYSNHLLVIEKAQPNSDDILDLITGEVYPIKGINSIRAYKDYFIVRTGATLHAQSYAQNNAIITRYLAPYTASVVLNGTKYFLGNFGKYLVFHPFNSLLGRVITDNDSAFNPDAILGDDGLISLAYSLGAGEMPNELVKLTQAEILALPIQDLTKLVDPVDNFGPVSQPTADGTPINLKPFFIGAPETFPRTGTHEMDYNVVGSFHIYNKFGWADSYERFWFDTDYFHLLEDGSNISRNVTQRFTDTRWYLLNTKVGFDYLLKIPQHVSIESEADTCAETNRVLFEREMWIHKHWKEFDCGPDLGIREVVALVYDPTNGAHSPGRYLELNFWAMDVGWIRFESHKSWIAYTPGNPKPNFTAQSLQSRSDFYRLGGSKVVPVLTSCFITPTPTPIPSLKKPEVTVENWLPELKNGWEFKFVDRENPGFGARVFAQDGSLYASFTNPVGSGYTGASRPFKVCGAVPPIEPPIEPPVEPPTAIQKVNVNGLVFRRNDGTLFPWRGFSSFLLLKHLLDGKTQEVKNYLNEWSLLGYNVTRVFTQVDWNGVPGPGFLPSDYSNYDVKVAELLDICSNYGIYIEYVAHTFNYEHGLMAEHIRRIDNIIETRNNAFLELTNEPPVNGIDIDSLVSALGSFNPNYPWATGQYHPTALPAGTYCTAHTDRDHEWPRKAKWLLEYREGGGPWDDTDPAMLRPIIGDEPIGAADFNQPGRRSNVPSDFFQYAALSQLLAAGSTFHHEGGLNSIYPDGVELECAKAFIAGAKAVPVEYQLGNYTATHINTSPVDDVSLRTYSMILGNKACSVRVRPTGPFMVRAGWKLISTVNDIVLFLERV